ncbi:MAG: methylmalonyl Co-A mutase-associated GTPase MeaB, partial [Actinobacteria bacterium]|nr:methylmalonyl Co-A mutase-associated GTPase MeaB [Actinomycetota bacterium]
ERSVARLVFPRTGGAWVVGVTGAPGVGKSSLVDALVACIRAAGDRVAVVAVDPSSAVSGGAILGDRFRMQRHATDAGVFVRSMASRGQLGGLARATLGAVRVLDASGWPWILIETVGAGQVELDVAGAADTTVVAVTPGWGDSLQVAKAGLMEAADVFVVNKSDRPGADEAVRDLELELDLDQADWRPPVVRTVAPTGEGVDGLLDAVRRHRLFLTDHGTVTGRRRERLASEVRRLAQEEGVTAIAAHCRNAAFDQVVAEVSARRLDPLAAADAVLATRPDG